jgi:putative ABC transport system permease protein
MNQLDTFLANPLNVIGAAAGLIALVMVLYFGRNLFFYARFIGKSLFRNLLRTALTGMAIIVLVFVVTLISTVLYTLNLVTTEKSKDFKAIVTERWQIPSQMPFSYEATLAKGAASKPGDVVPDDAMSWGFFVGSTDPEKLTRENLMFFFCMEPAKLLRLDPDGTPHTMMDGIDSLTKEELADLDRACREMERDRTAVVVGKDRLEALNKKVGETVKVTGIQVYRGIELEVRIVAVLPAGRYDNGAILNREYMMQALEDYKKKQGKPHFMADRTLSLMWLRVPDTQSYQRVADQVMTSSLYTAPAVKCETASSGIASFFDGYREILWGIRWLLVPAILVTMALVIANAISISVRERRTEMAVLKVLGFRPGQILALVLGEALLIGAVCGLLSAGLTFYYINIYKEGLKFPVGFFPVFMVPRAALWWGLLMGAGTALAGSILPAWSARSVKVSEVFAKVA